MEGITHQNIVDFINMVQPDWEKELVELEHYAYEHNVPIIQKEASRFLYLIGLIKKPDRILEVGTAIGYSGLILSKTLNRNGQLVTIERDDKMFEVATNNVTKFGFEHKIKIIHGDALSVLPQLEDEFDIIFIDAAKGQYEKFFEFCYDLLKSGGIIISDNVLFKGKVAYEIYTENQLLVQNEEIKDKKNRTIIRRMRDYLKMITSHEGLETSILPIGDGIALSYKR